MEIRKENEPGSKPALSMSASAAIADPLLRRAFGQRARPSAPHRTARVRIGASGLHALVSQHGSTISRRTVMNSAGWGCEENRYSVSYGGCGVLQQRGKCHCGDWRQSLG